MFRHPRPKPRRSERRPKRKNAVRNPIGRDFKRVRPPRALSDFIPAAIALLVAAFALTSLRTEVLKLRYELADQLEREQELRATQGELTVQMRTLREPRQLAQRAVKLGFERPQRVIDLPVLKTSASLRSILEPAEAERRNTAGGERIAGVPGDVRP